MDTNGSSAGLLDPPIDPALTWEGQKQLSSAPDVPSPACSSPLRPPNNTDTPPCPCSQISGSGGSKNDSLKPGVNVSGARVSDQAYRAQVVRPSSLLCMAADNAFCYLFNYLHSAHTESRHHLADLCVQYAGDYEGDGEDGWGEVISGVYDFKQGVHMMSSLAYTFKSFVVDVFGTLSHGATLITGRKELILGDILEAFRTLCISVLHVTPSNLAVVRLDEYATLETVVVAGEALGKKLIEDWSGCVTLRNTYGPMEASVDSTSCHVTSPSLTCVIGRPLSNCGIYISDIRSSFPGISFDMKVAAGLHDTTFTPAHVKVLAGIVKEIITGIPGVADAPAAISKVSKVKASNGHANGSATLS
ncbi:hypothetical protein HYDPIDRAFT_33641 [Hydnomerulius pinastri MD-312]|uniref:AMP-dependent synthetase/ligase domain-containing protein n=1 Tax=Hydnomerulius pinastri MD-312 TaxID=994086 RepID=A0A0C9W8G9_9AGAM|nr:hypothetical protein HYDPIDRAFT_33641 [Hydnomerulius pinastri MD-312]